MKRRKPRQAPLYRPTENGNWKMASVSDLVEALCEAGCVEVDRVTAYVDGAAPTDLPHGPYLIIPVPDVKANPPRPYRQIGKWTRTTNG